MKRWAPKLWALCLTCCTSGQAALAQNVDTQTTTTSANTQPVYTYTDYRLGARNLYAGAEAVFIAPIFGANGSTLVTAQDVGGGAFTSQTNTNSSAASQFAFAPRVWIGAGLDDGYGVRARFFDLRTTSGSNSAINLANPASVGAFSSSNFNMYAVDLELTREIYLRRSIAMTSFGCRTAGVSLGNSNTNVLVAPTATDLLVASAATNNSFYGTGLTTATQWMRPVYQGAFGNIGIYAMGRGSVLWGNENTSVNTQASVFGPGLIATANNGASVGPSNTMWIGELQAGTQWNKVLTNAWHTRAFVRVAFEYQNWGLGTIGSARSGSFAERTFGGGVVDRVTAQAVAGSLQNLSLVGFGISTGFYW